MGKIICSANHKGGVGKSTLTCNIGCELAMAGNKVLVVDSDPQGDTTKGLGFLPREIEHTLQEVFSSDALKKTVDLNSLIIQTRFDNLSLIPANPDLAGAELSRSAGAEFALKFAFEPLKEKYDYIIFDTPPSLGLLTIASLVASDILVVPVQCEHFATMNMGEFMNTYRLVKTRLNPSLQLGGAVINMYDSRNNMCDRAKETIMKFFGEDKTYKTVIPRSIKVSEAQEVSLPVQQYLEDNKASIAFKELAKEIVA
jgi:chromosome partitioning protein